jgi:hypothetical protein
MSRPKHTGRRSHKSDSFDATKTRRPTPDERAQDDLRAATGERHARDAQRLRALADELRTIPARRCGLGARETLATTLLANALRAGAFSDPRFEGFRSSVKAHTHWTTVVGYLKRNAERLGLPPATWTDGWATELLHGCKYVADMIEGGPVATDIQPKTRIDDIAKAIGIFSNNPHMSDREVARRAGMKSSSRLSRSEAYKRVKRAFAADRPAMGSKGKDGSIEAVAD